MSSELSQWSRRYFDASYSQVSVTALPEYVVKLVPMSRPSTNTLAFAPITYRPSALPRRTSGATVALSANTAVSSVSRSTVNSYHWSSERMLPCSSVQ